MTTTSIEWADETWNVAVGCSRISAGCGDSTGGGCYAEAFAHRGLTDAHRGVTRQTPSGPRWTGKVKLLPERLDIPLRWRKPRRIFVCSMSDLFHESVPDDFIDKVFAVMALAPQHTFLVLTKRPERMRDYSLTLVLGKRRVGDALRAIGRDGLVSRLAAAAAFGVRAGTPSEPPFSPFPNVHLGISCEDQRAANARVPILCDTPAAVRFLSLEPLLGPINLDGIWGYPGSADSEQLARWPIQWVIAGGESGPHARACNVAWIRDIVRQCREAGCAPYVKQLGARPIMTLREWNALDCIRDKWTGIEPAGTTREDALGIARLLDSKGGDPSEWPADLRVREFPR